MHEIILSISPCSLLHLFFFFLFVCLSFSSIVSFLFISLSLHVSIFLCSYFFFVGCFWLVSYSVFLHLWFLPLSFFVSRDYHILFHCLSLLFVTISFPLYVCLSLSLSLFLINFPLHAIVSVQFCHSSRSLFHRKSMKLFSLLFLKSGSTLFSFFPTKSTKNEKGFGGNPSFLSPK